MTSRLEPTPKSPPAGWRAMWRAWRSQDVGTGVGAGFSLAERGDRRLLWALALLGLHAVGNAQIISGGASKQSEGGLGTETNKVEALAMTQPVSALAGNAPNLVVLNAVSVRFNPDVFELSDAETRNFIDALATYGPVTTSRWRISVLVPRGLPEALRLGFHRANAVRNVLVKSGVPSGNIELQVQHSTQQGSDSTRVVVRLAGASAGNASNLVAQSGLEVTATKPSPAMTGAYTQTVQQGGVVVQFKADVLELSDADGRDVIEKMATFAPVATSKWRISVLVPKGSSQAQRLASQRVSWVQNVLLKNGVPTGNIDLQTSDSTHQTADATLVIIRPAS